MFKYGDIAIAIKKVRELGIVEGWTGIFRGYVGRDKMLVSNGDYTYLLEIDNFIKV